MEKELTADIAADEVLTDEIEDDVTNVAEPEAEEVNTEEAAQDGEQEPELATEQETEPGGLVVTIGEEEDEDENASQPFRDMRQELRETKRKLKELEAAQATAPQEVGEEPQLADFDYDAGKYKTALLDWNTRKQKAEADAKAKEEEGQKLASQFQEKLSGYKAKAKELPVKDFDEVEELVRESLPEVTQNIIVDCAEKPELMVYALGKNPKIMADLPKGGTFRDAVAAAYALGKMEAGLKVTGMKNKPKPEGRVTGGARLPKTGDQKLEELEAEAARTGNRTKVLAHKRSLKQAKGK